MLELGPEQLRKIDDALSREWLITNGIGGYATASVIGTPTRRAHGLLIAAQHPPGDRVTLVSQCEEMLTYAGRLYLISTNEYEDGTLAPAGYVHLLQFRLERGLPVTVYEIGDTTLEKSIWMAYGVNTTYIRYQLAETAHGPVELRLRPLISGRPLNHLVHGDPDQSPHVVIEDGWCQVSPPGSKTAVRLRLTGDRFEPKTDWYWRVLYRRERERGLDFSEDLFAPGTLATTLWPGGSATLIISTAAPAQIVTDSALAWQTEWQRRGALIERAQVAPDDSLGHDLVLAADAFLVASESTPSAADTAPTMIIAGYPWLGESGRDSMIALPGLTLATGRPEVARSILSSLLSRQESGRLPTTWSEALARATPARSDAGLWLFVALRRYLDATGDVALLRSHWLTLVEIIRAYYQSDGTPGLIANQEQGLLRLQAPNGRSSARVDLNALWYNALRQMAEWSKEQATPQTNGFALAADRVQSSFDRHFWSAPNGYLFDAIDGEPTYDLRLRPGQVLAIGLPYAVLDENRWRPVLDTITDHLLTDFGLRSLTPIDPDYIGWYAGDEEQRIRAFDRGTIWPWLFEWYAAAHERVYGFKAPFPQQLGVTRRQLRTAALGFISELLDGDPPHTPRGCSAQATSIAAALRVWVSPGRQAVD